MVIVCGKCGTQVRNLSPTLAHENRTKDERKVEGRRFKSRKFLKDVKHACMHARHKFVPTA